MSTDFKLIYLDGKGGVLKKEKKEVASYISWHHINYTSSKSKNWLKSNSFISKSASNILLASETRPRAIVEDNEVVLCLRGVNLNQSSSPEDMISVRIWIGGNTIVTSCNRRSQSIVNIQHLLAQANGPKNIEQLLISLIEQLGLLTEDFIDSLESTLDHEEDNIAEATFDSFNPRMSKLRRQIATIKRYLAPQKQALDKLYRSKTIHLKDTFYDNLYVQVDKSTYILESLDLMRERVLVLQEQFMGYLSHQQNSRLYLLAIVSAIFLPLTFLSGLLGMNVGGLPGINSPLSFWLVTGFCTVVAIGLLAWFKRKKWF